VRSPFRTGPIDRSEITSLADRLGVLQGVRAVICLTVLGSAFFAPDVVGVHAGQVARLTGFYIFASVATEVARRTTEMLAADTVFGMLMVDALYIGLILFLNTGPSSLLVFLVYVHLIAVTLLTSYRTGLKIALWYSVLFFGLDVLRVKGALNGLTTARFTTRPHEIMLSVLAFWMVALCTAALSAVNERELRRGKAELRLLADMGARLEHAESAEQVGQVLLDTVVGSFPFRRGAVIAGTEAGGWWALAAADAAPVTLARGGPVPTDAVVGRCWTARAPALVKSLHPDDDPILAQLLPRARNVIVFPLVADAQPIGVLALEWGGPVGVRVPARTVTIVTQFAAHAALALRSAWLLAEVERLATFDSLTGLLNRRVFENVLEREVTRARRTAQPLSLIVLDIDHFKKINDTYGHQAGDEVLRHVGHSLRAVGRDVDAVARYGGEEFAIILPSCGASEAVKVSERLRAAVAGGPGPIRVTCSAGVASLPANAGDGTSLVSAADHALYDSKAAGRDRTTRSRRRRRGSAPLEEAARLA
jgi:diguanylate cyclase (GGDEF)-like protein